MADSEPESPLAVFRRHAAAGRLAFQFSPGAGRAVFFPRLLCPYTGSSDLEWRISSGRGVVYAVSAVTPARGGEPYCVALIDVEEGFRMMSTVLDLAPEDVAIGMPVRATFSGDETEPVVRFVRDDR